MSKFSRIPLQIARISRVIPTISSLPPISIRNSFKPAIPSFSRNASSSTASSTTFDPQVVEAQRKLDEGNSLSEQGDLQAAKIAFEASLAIKVSSIQLET